jgi:hypothetical protein
MVQLTSLFLSTSLLFVAAHGRLPITISPSRILMFFATVSAAPNLQLEPVGTVIARDLISSTLRGRQSLASSVFASNGRPVDTSSLSSDVDAKCGSLCGLNVRNSFSSP